MDVNMNWSSAPEIFEKALEVQRANNFNAAQTLYEKVLTIEPQHPEANHNLGVLCGAKNEFLKALELFKNALNSNPNVSLFWASYIDCLIKLNRITEAKTITLAAKNSGLFCERLKSLYVFLTSEHQEPISNFEELQTLLNEGKFEDAIYKCKDLMKAYPKSAMLSLVLGQSYQELGDKAKAVTNYEKVAKYQSKWPQGLIRLGELNFDSDNLTSAINYFQKAIEVEPQYIDAYSKLGEILRLQGKFNDAIKYLEKALHIDPGHADSHCVMGLILLNKGENTKAINSLKLAIQFDPNNAPAYCNLGVANINYDQGTALKYYEKALEIDPNHSVTLSNIGSLLNAMGRSEAAKTKIHESLKLKPNYAEAHFNLGVTYSENNEPSAALSSFNKCLKYDPSHRDAPSSIALEILKNQNFKDGWLEHEARWGAKSCDSSRISTSKPKWDPTRKHERVLLWQEQGLGDIIMFASLIPELHNSVGQLIVSVNERLLPLFKRSFSNDIIFRSDNRKIFENEYDSHIPLGSLPLYFRPSLESFKKTSGRYLKHNSDLTSKIREQLTNDGGGLIYGISWRGGSHQNNVNRNKEIGLEKFAKIFDGQKVQLVNLQYGDTAQELDLLAKNQGIDVISVKEIDNFMDIDGLASLISACDSVVSTDNSTVFLAGSLGKKTNVLLPFANDWRWGRKLNQSYWHSSLTLYRQKQRGDWSHPIKQLNMDLDKN